jgi:hypothetical protein
MDNTTSSTLLLQHTKSLGIPRMVPPVYITSVNITRTNTTISTQFQCSFDQAHSTTIKISNTCKSFWLGNAANCEQLEQHSCGKYIHLDGIAQYHASIDVGLNIEGVTVVSLCSNVVVGVHINKQCIPPGVPHVLDHNDYVTLVGDVYSWHCRVGIGVYILYFKYARI